VNLLTTVLIGYSRCKKLPKLTRPAVTLETSGVYQRSKQALTCAFGLFKTMDLVQVNLLTTVLNDSPVLPDETEEDALPILMDSPQSVAFGIFIIW